MRRSSVPVLAWVYIAVVVLAGAKPCAGQAALVSHVGSPSGAPTAITTNGANFLAVCAHGGQPITSSLGNTFAEAFAQTNGFGGSNVSLYVSFGPKTGSDTIKANGYPFTAAAFSGVASGPDRTGEGTNNYPLVTGSITPSKANELILSCFLGQFPKNPTPKATAANMTTLDDAMTVNSMNGVADAYKVQTTPAPIAATWDNNQGNGSGGLIASFFSAGAPGPLAITTAHIDEAVTGSSFNFCLGAGGGLRPYTWSAAGALPAGVRLNPASGCFSGKPTAATPGASLQITVSDSQARPATSSKTLALAVASATLSQGTKKCSSGTQYKSYSCTLLISGGIPPYTCTTAHSPAYAALPAGLTFDSPCSHASGTDYQAGPSVVGVVVKDAAGQTLQTETEFSFAGDYTLPPGQRFFPADSVWYLDVRDLPVDTSPFSHTFYPTSHVHIDFGNFTTPAPAGIPWMKVPADAPSNVGIKVCQPGAFTFATGPLPSKTAFLESLTGDVEHDGSDHHGLFFYLAGNGHGARVYETYQAYPGLDSSGTWLGYQDSHCGQVSSGIGLAYSAVVFDTASNKKIPDDGTSVDAAGTPIAVTLYTPDELMAGEAEHAGRVTFNHMGRGHVFPAVSQAAGYGTCGYANTDSKLLDQVRQPSANGCTLANPFGELYRLKASTPYPSGCPNDGSTAAKIIHNLFLSWQHKGVRAADNGGTWFISGVPDNRWPEKITCLQSLIGNDFEPVLVQPSAVDPLHSYQVKGSPGRSAR